MYKNKIILIVLIICLILPLVLYFFEQNEPLLYVLSGVGILISGYLI